MPLTREQKIKLVEALKEKHRRVASPQTDPSLAPPVSTGMEPSAASAASPTFLEAVGRGAMNFPKSLYGLGKDIVESGISAAQNPFAMSRGIAKMGLGFATSQAMGGNPALATPEYRALVDDYTNAYGSWDAAKKTLAEDPARVMADVASLAMGGGALLKAGGLAKAAAVASKVGAAVEPFGLAARTAGVPFKAAGTVFKYGAGIGTARGVEAFNIAERGSKGFRQGLWGKITPEENAALANRAFEGLLEKRGIEYASKLQGIKASGQRLDITAVRNKADELRDSYRIKREVDPNTGQIAYDFRGSTLPKADAGQVQEIFETIDQWGADAADLTPMGVDALKRKIGNFYSQNRDNRQIVANLRKEVEDILDANVPGYKEMTANYAKASEDIKALQKGLNLGTRESADVAIRKLTSSLKQNNEYRRHLVKHLEESGAGELLDRIAGVSMQPMLAEGIVGKLIAGTGVATGALIDPMFISLFAMASPQVAGNLVMAYGKARQAVRAASRTVPPWARGAAYTTGVVYDATQAKQQEGP